MTMTATGWRVAGWSGAAALLALPAAAMLVTREVRWSASDFLVFGAMVLAAGGAIELAMRTVRAPSGRIAVALGVAAVFLLVWAELAVGLFD